MKIAQPCNLLHDIISNHHDVDLCVGSATMRHRQLLLRSLNPARCVDPFSTRSCQVPTALKLASIKL
jgi:hypothetical protein